MEKSKSKSEKDSPRSLLERLKGKRSVRKYILTDQCFYMEDGGGKDYNPDDRRKPHITSVVDMKTGTIRQLKSGTVITVIEDATE
jgi:hypothetical protein